MKIAIAGYGVEGKSSYSYFAALGNQVTILDEREHVDDLPPDAAVVLGAPAFSQLEDYDMVIRTPSLPPHRLGRARKVWSATNEFFAQCTTPIIGVTGTKGKGTTSSMINSILRASGRKTVLVGNIGLPALEMLDEANKADVVVYELSSFQLWDIERSPQVAVVLMIESDHLNVHANFDDYVRAKANIRKFQTEKDICFYHPTNEFSRRIAEASSLPNAHRYNDPSDQDSVCIEGEWFTVGDRQLLPAEAVQLPGRFNLENACAAISAVREFTWDLEKIEQGLRAFAGLDHRLKFVRTVKGVDYYDDSIATTPGSVVAAIKAFDSPKILILGGSSKGTTDFRPIAEAAKTGNIKAVILIGDQAEMIAKVLENVDTKIINLGSQVTMDDIVRIAQQEAARADVVILSPACASFDMFKSYSDRGDQFINAVDSLEESA